MSNGMLDILEGEKIPLPTRPIAEMEGQMRKTNIFLRVAQY
jgi:hypothetical protein